MRLASFLVAAALIAFMAACGPAGGPRSGGTLYTGELKPNPNGLDSSPHGTSQSQAPTSPECPAPTLVSIREQILIPSCATGGCHDSATHAENLDLSLDLDALRGRLSMPAHQSPTGVGLITANKRGSSYLFLKVFLEGPLVGETMPPPPKARLDACAIAALGAWIDAGTP